MTILRLPKSRDKNVIFTSQKHLEKEFIEKKLPEFLQLMEDKLASKTQQFLVGNSVSMDTIIKTEIFETRDQTEQVD